MFGENADHNEMPQPDGATAPADTDRSRRRGVPQDGPPTDIVTNICQTLDCDPEDIEDFGALDSGLTNHSFTFTAPAAGKREKYVYRRPGAGTDEIINRESEAFSQTVARELGIDDTYVYQSPEEGWKISRFIPVTETFDVHNADHVSQALGLLRTLHNSDAQSPWEYDYVKRTEEFANLLERSEYPEFPEFERLRAENQELAAMVAARDVTPVLCHNDFFSENFLISNDNMSLIDWEYSAMSDPAGDLGNFVATSDYSVRQAEDFINEYYGGQATPDEMRHGLAYVAIASYHWLVWALYKEQTGDPVGDYAQLWYDNALKFGAAALNYGDS